jgi:hypothetical protein
MKNLILKITLFLAILGSLFMVPMLATAATGIDCAHPASAKEQIQCGACGASGAASCDPSPAPKKLSDTIATVINIISVFGGALAVIMIIIGGMRYITSAGSPEGAKGARNTIVYAVVGLVIIGIAQIIVHFVINSVK